jgi:O-antigen ligase
MAATSFDSDIADYSRRDQWLFRCLQGLVFWLPLPLASNRAWAIGILVLAVCLLCAAFVLTWRKQASIPLAILGKFALPLAIFGAFVLFSFFQVLPLPASWVAILSPNSFKIQQAAGLSAYGMPMHLSLDVYHSSIMSSLSCIYFFTFVLILLLVRTPDRLDRLALTLVWSGLFQALVGVLLYSFGAEYRLFFYNLLHANVIGTFVNRNHFAGYMEMTLAIGIGLMLARLGSRSPSYSGWRHRVVNILTFLMSPKMRLRIMLVIMVIALVLTRSRMGNTAFFASMLIVGVISLPLSWRTAPATIALIISLIVVDVVLVGTWVGLDKVVSRLNQTNIAASTSGNNVGTGVGTGVGNNVGNNGGRTEDSLEERLLPARHALDMIADYPVFGTGAGSFYSTFSTYRPPEIAGYYDHAHNDYAEIASDLGLLGSGMLAALVLLTFGVSLKVLYQRRSSLPRGIAFGAMMSIVALAIHSSVDFNLQIPANAMSFVMILALAWVAAKLPSQRKTGKHH